MKCREAGNWEKIFQQSSEKGINTVILENHGLVTVADDLFQAFMQFETLDFCARLEIKSRQIGTPVSLTDDQLSFRRKSIQPFK